MLSLYDYLKRMIGNKFAEACDELETAAVDPVKETAAKPAARTRKA